MTYGGEPCQRQSLAGQIEQCRASSRRVSSYICCGRIASPPSTTPSGVSIAGDSSSSRKGPIFRSRHHAEPFFFRFTQASTRNSVAPVPNNESPTRPSQAMAPRKWNFGATQQIKARATRNVKFLDRSGAGKFSYADQSVSIVNSAPVTPPAPSTPALNPLPGIYSRFPGRALGIT